MKIVFKQVRIKNFLSFGNSETIFDYNTGINVVTGVIEGGTSRNGIGKSALLVDSLSFAIYGKPLRGDAHIKKEDLINRVNGKNCKVEVDFTIGKDEYTVVRTIKPTSLTVYENGKEIKFDRMSNTQDWLQTKIGISHTCFSNILVLNVNSSKPFLSMDAKDKRQVIEDVLSMNVYGRMSDMAKDMHLTLKGEKQMAQTAMEQSINNFQMATENRNQLLEHRAVFDKEKEENCSEILEDIKTLNDRAKNLKEKITDRDYDSELEIAIKKQESIDNKLMLLGKKEAEANKTLKDCKNTLKVLEHAPYCPTCKTPTDGPLIQKFITETKECVETQTKILEDIDGKRTKGIEAKDSVVALIDNLRNERDNQNDAKRSLEHVEESIDKKQLQLEKEMNRSFNAADVVSEDKIEEFRSLMQEAEDTFNSISQDFEYYNYIRSVLGEEGVRKFVLAKIIPFLNSKVNQYLKIMGSDFTLIFDNSLNEEFITRSRDIRNYSSFSSGERKRIDLAVLLALMDVAKMQNSVDTNILILDEVLDTSMDSDGVESFLDYLKTGFKKLYPNKAIYIITHRKDIGDEHFDSVINLVKKRNFTYIDNVVDMKAA